MLKISMLARLVTIILVAQLVKCADDCSSSESSEISGNAEACFDKQSFNYSPLKEIQQDKSVEFECYVRNKDSSSVVWYFNDQIIAFEDRIVKPDPKFHLDTDKVSRFNLRVSHVEPHHQGTYKCQVIGKVTKNLEYKLEVLIPPTIVREPSDSVITLKEGDSVAVQCLAHGHPRPEITWSKKGKKLELNAENKQTLTLENVDDSHADVYSCTAKNSAGSVTSDFTIQVRFKPRVRIVESDNVNNSVMYSAVGRKERIGCAVNAYPAPRISLLFNNVPIENYITEEVKDNESQFAIAYEFVGSAETFGEYRCIAENELGVSSTDLAVKATTSEVSLNTDNLPVYSDAAVFEWTLYSGSPVVELDVQVFSANNTNGTNFVTKTKEVAVDGTEQPASYHVEKNHFRDFYVINKLASNTTYHVRMRAKNEYGEYSEWSQNITLKTSGDVSQKIIKHKSLHHHRHYDKNHRMYGMPGSNLNLKRDRFNSYSIDGNSATVLREQIWKYVSLALLSLLVLAF